MQLILNRGAHSYFFARIQDAGEFEALPGAASGFGCLLWDDAGAWSSGQRGALLRRLLEAGCRSLACGGHECEAWHDAADEVLAWLNATTWSAAERFVMTTWHTGESPAEVAFYVTSAAAVEEPALREYLVLQLGGTDGVADVLVSAIREYAGG